MESQLKKNIRLLAEKFEHNIGYDKNDIVVTSELNHIRISSLKKGYLSLTFNSSLEKNKIEVSNQDFYNCFIEILLRREVGNEIDFIEGDLITIEDWINEEGRYAGMKLEQLKKIVSSEPIEYFNLGGNRLEAEYFKGIIILIDDIRGFKSNVVDLIL